MGVTKSIEFLSQGVRCRGMLLLPEAGEPPYPTVIMAGGWCYVKEIVMPHYAPFFLETGLAVLMFDYRGFGASEGFPRQHIDPWAQIEDYRNAMSYAQTVPELDAQRMAVWGISYSGGHVLVLAAIDPRIRCVVSNIPVVDGYETLLRDHGERQFTALQNLLYDDRQQRYRGEPSGQIPMSALNPQNTLSTWPFPDIYEGFAKIKHEEAPAHEHWSTIESVEMLLNYTVFPYVPRILNTPTLVIVAEGDDITSWDLEIEAYRQITCDTKKLFVIPQTSHMKLYGSLSHLELAAREASAWFDRYLL